MTIYIIISLVGGLVLIFHAGFAHDFDMVFVGLLWVIIWPILVVIWAVYYLGRWVRERYYA